MACELTADWLGAALIDLLKQHRCDICLDHKVDEDNGMSSYDHCTGISIVDGVKDTVDLLFNDSDQFHREAYTRRFRVIVEEIEACADCGVFPPWHSLRCSRVKNGRIAKEG